MTISNPIRCLFDGGGGGGGEFITKIGTILVFHIYYACVYICIEWIVIISLYFFWLALAFRMLLHCTIFHYLPSVFLLLLVAIIDMFCYFLVSLSLSSFSLLLLTFFIRSSSSSSSHLRARVCVCIFLYLRSRYAVSCSCNSNVDQMKWMAKSSQTQSERTHVVTRVSVFDIIRMFIRFFIS